MPDELTEQLVGALRRGDLEISAFQAYGNGTVQVTLKPPAPATTPTTETTR